MGKVQLTESEQKLLTLVIVKECINNADEQGELFEDVFKELIFPGDSDYSPATAEMICKNMEILRNEGYIKGQVELVYTELDEGLGETKSGDIDFTFSEFRDIQIALKGKTYLEIDGLKNISKDFFEKAKPVVKTLGKTAVQSAVQVSIVALAKAFGLPI